MAKRCIAKTLSGDRCPWNALEGSNYCGMHGPDAKPLFHAKRSMKKAAKKAAKKTAKKR